MTGLGSPSDDIRQVFERPEFDRSPSWWARTADTVGRWLDHVPFGAVGRFVAWIAIGIAALVLLRSVARAVHRAWVRRRNAPRVRTNVESVIGPLGMTDPTEWNDAASRAVAQTDWKEAVRCRYGELVAVLVRTGVVSGTAGATTGEIRADLAAACPNGAVAFGEITDIFEEIWFGRRVASQSDHDVVVRNSAAVRSELGDSNVMAGRHV